MSYTYEKIASNKAKLSFVVSAEDFDAAMQKSYLKNRSRINVPGWRKGKAPRKVIENMYGEGVFYDDALDMIFNTLYFDFSSSCSNIFTSCVIRDNLRPILSGSNNQSPTSTAQKWEKVVNNFLKKYNSKLDSLQ